MRSARRVWAAAFCASLAASVAAQETTSHLKDASIGEKPISTASNATPDVKLTSGARGLVNQAGRLFDQARRLFANGDCTTQTVVSGDSCGSLASKCGISDAQFAQFNPQSDLCSTLTPGQRVCCSPGSLPDIRPKPNPDGSCASYTVQSLDTCSAIANNNGLTANDISNLNDKTTWGWSGCNDLMAGLAICLSTGTPPMPAPVANAVCGPIMPGTSPPKGSVALADLNPCPLNACCNIWGQCGITPEYCTAETGPTGNPGTAPPGHNGCISNCGTAIAGNSQAPSTFTKVGYYESWNWDRNCLNMRSDSIDTTVYTHAHWSFATITSDWDVLINDTYSQFPPFVALTGIKRIVSFGGWGYSTDPSTYEVLRNAMDPSNSGIFTDNIVNFLNKNGLDGVDFDWEYPGAPDIPGIPPGLASDGPNYLAFLKLLRGKMPQGKTISIAAPASYWYLRAFPIADIAKNLDYIVYMTYDLHGQWDYGNSWSQDGCPAGNCLRSHINLTETMYALAMITKAGVPTSKIIVGVSSYGRSFGMTQAGCFGPMCSFGGPESTATPGECTVTAGYISNAEIYGIINANTTNPQTWYDTDSNSDILVYDGNQWVAFMSDDTKTSRTNYYKSLGFGGIIDWALDLQQFTDEDRDADDDDDGLPPASILPSCDASYNSIEDLDAAAGSIPSNCRAIYLVDTLSKVLNSAIQSYTDMMKSGYDAKFNTYAQAIADSAASTVRDFVNNNGNQYFSCIVSETSVCCSYCNGGAHSASQCNYCFSGDCFKTCSTITGCSLNERALSERVIKKRADNEHANNGSDRLGQMEEQQLFGQLIHPVEHEAPGHEQVLIVRTVNESEPCPPDYSKRGFGPNNPYEQSVYWSLDPDKANKFWADLLTNTGITQNKIKFENFDRGNDCAPSAKPNDPCWGTGMDYGMATPSGYSKSDVSNPKDIVQKALSNSNNLAGQLTSVLRNLKLDCYDGDSFELVDSVSVPVLMIADAIDSMAQVESVANQIDEEKRKALILAFLGAILFFVPIAGEVLGAVTELADVASVISILGAVGNAAMDVYTIVDDPQNAPLAIFDLILSPLALADLAQITKAAKIRRGMSDDDVAKLGGRVAARMTSIRKVTGICHKAV